MCGWISYFAKKATLVFIVFHVAFCVNKSKLINVDLSKSMKFVPKIIGGKPSTIESFPSIVQFFNFGSMCSGVIINSWSIITAAHCFDHNQDVYNMVVQAGARYTQDKNAKVYTISKFVIHEDYNVAMPFACDIAIMFVNEPIRFGEKVKKAILVNNIDWMKERNYTKYFIAGWGWTKYGGPISKIGLMSSHLRYVSKEKCEAMHKITLMPHMFCLYGEGERDSCKGDSGSAVQWKGKVVGLVSHGDGCAKKGKPSVYINIWYFQDWIKQQVMAFVRSYCQEMKSRDDRTF